MNVTIHSIDGQEEAFQITTCVKQGCVIAPTLFSLFISVTLHLIEGQLKEGKQNKGGQQKRY